MRNPMVTQRRSLTARALRHPHALLAILAVYLDRRGISLDWLRGVGRFTGAAFWTEGRCLEVLPVGGKEMIACSTMVFWADRTAVYCWDRCNRMTSTSVADVTCLAGQCPTGVATCLPGPKLTRRVALA